MNDNSVVFVFMFMIFVVGGIGIAVAMVKHVETRRRFEQLARRFHGTLSDAEWFGSPSVNFDYQGFPVRIRQSSSGSKKEKKFTEFQTHWPDPGFRCQVRPQRTLDYVGRFLGVHDIEIGSPAFDARYVIGGNDSDKIQSFLTPSVQRHIDHLYFFLGNSHIFFSIQGGQLEIKKLGRVLDFHSLEQFTKLCLELLLDAQTAGMKGIEFVAPVAMRISADVMCQICGDGIDVGDVVFCRSCRTPHHEDCWNYFGACSTFGCGQKVFKRSGKRSKDSSL